MTEDEQYSPNQFYEDRKFEELRLLYSQALEDIRYHKKQQVQYLDYTIVLYSIIIFLLSSFSQQHISIIIKTVLTCLSIFILIVGIYLTYITQSEIKKGRKRVEKSILHFTPAFLNALGHEKEDKRTSTHSWWIFHLFLIIQLIGEFIVLIIVWRNPTS